MAEQSPAFAAFIKLCLEGAAESDTLIQEWIDDDVLPLQLRLELMSIQTKIRVLAMTVEHVNNMQMEVEERLSLIVTKYAEAAKLV